MRQFFRGHYRPTQAEFDTLWNDCIFSFDTSVLLNVYRYSPKARERLFDILEKLSERIWIPHQVGLEYHEKYLDVASEQQAPYNEVSDLLDKQLKELENLLSRYSKRHSFNAFADAHKIKDSVLKIHNRIKNQLKVANEQCFNSLDVDVFKEKIADLLEGKVGEPYAPDRSQEIYKEAKDAV